MGFSQRPQMGLEEVWRDRAREERVENESHQLENPNAQMTASLLTAVVVLAEDLRPPHQMRGLQFRSIAPKVPSGVSASAILSCHTPSTPPDATPGPKSIVVPAQNYALMQVAGQGGAFSLVALPPSVSPPSSQQQTQKGLPSSKNQKLPIPRYQPTQSKSTSEKVGPALATRSATLSTWPPESLECSSKTESSDQVMLIDSGSAEISVATLLSDSSILCSSPWVERIAKMDFRHPTRETLAFVAKVQEESNKNSPCLSKSGGITIISPAVFSKVVQIVPSPPKGKLPIPRYSKMKSSLLPLTKISTKSAEKGFPEPLCGLTNSTSLSHADTDVMYQKQPPTMLQQSQLQAKVTNLSSMGLGLLQKPAGKKRGRKRKTIEDILAFESRKKRSLSFFRRRAPDKSHSVSTGPKEKALDISKKYRSIRPKPVLVLETVPQLLGLSPLSGPKCLEQEFLLSRQLPGKMLDCRQLEPTVERPGSQRVAGSTSGYTCLTAKQLHRCPTCARCFQFKHHLQNHVNSHTNRRPHVCPMCHKAYAHSGSLSTHIKLHHAEGQPRKTLICEFCDRAFSYMGVYLSHMREVHKVLLTVQPSVSQRQEDLHIEGMKPSNLMDKVSQEQDDPVQLQMKCGRCLAVTPTFADMTLHLLCVHGEEVQANRREGAARGGSKAENEPVKHATPERRNLVKCGSCGEEFFSFSKLKRHIYSNHRGEPEVTVECEEPDGEPGSEILPPGSLVLHRGDAYHCVLCTACLDSKQKLLAHWGHQHNCEDPGSLWTVLSSLVKHKGVDFSTRDPQQQGPV